MQRFRYFERRIAMGRGRKKQVFKMKRKKGQEKKKARIQAKIKAAK